MDVISVTINVFLIIYYIVIMKPKERIKRV